VITLGPLMQRAAVAPVADLEGIIGEGGLVVLAPHPDDESLGCGALLRAAARSGRQCCVVVVTDGRLSHRHSPTVDADALAALRAKEVTAAVAALHPTIRLVQFRYPDCSAPSDPAVGARLALIPDEVGATALAVATVRPALRHWSYPIWGRFALAQTCSLRDAPIVRFATDAYREAKAAAIACHRSQMTALIDDDPTGFVMDPAMQTHFLAHPEVFIAD
jgi:LmbE family N-acetylglucosaminyl deacetylase